MAWRPARCLTVLRDQLDAMYPDRSKASDGIIGDAAHAAGYSEHNPDSRGIVHAIDITHDPANGLDIDALSDVLVASRDERILYIIANGLIADSRYGWTWEYYVGSDDHTGHLHMSVKSAPYEDQTQPWNLTGMGAGNSMSGEADHAAGNIPEIDSNGVATGNVTSLQTAMADVWSNTEKANNKLNAIASVLAGIGAATTPILTEEQFEHFVETIRNELAEVIGNAIREVLRNGVGE